MAKSDPRITLDPKLNEAIEAVASLRSMNKRELVDEILSAGLNSREFEMRIMEVLKILGERLVHMDSSIRIIADFIADRWSTDHDDTDEQD